MDVAIETRNTLLDLQHRPIELGRIRTGYKATSKNGKEYPAKLETFRLTSGSRAYLDAAASLYGGTVESWGDAPDEGMWQLVTESSELRVLIPRDLRTVSQAYELWQGGTCERRCDGTREQLTDGPCICASIEDPEAERCDPVTRISIMLPDLPGLGVWRLDSGGWNAATSLPATIELLRQLSTQPWIPAILRLEQRSKKVREGGKVVTHRFAVPVLDLPNLTIGKVIARQGIEAPQLPAERPTVPTAAERAAERAAAITSGPSRPADVSPGVQDTEASDDPGPSSEPPGEPPPHAGARSVTPDPVPGTASAGNPTPAPCTGFNDPLGKCVREDGHEGNHRNKDMESWA